MHKFKTPCILCQVAHNNLPPSLRNDISEQKMRTIKQNVIEWNKDEMEMVQHAGIHSNEFSISYTYIGVLLVILLYDGTMLQCEKTNTRQLKLLTRMTRKYSRDFYFIFIWIKMCGMKVYIKGEIVCRL